MELPHGISGECFMDGNARKHHPSFSSLHYLSGEDVRKGDVVKICGKGGVWKSAKIAETFKAGEEGAHDYSLDEGGFLVEFPDGGLEAWHEADEDIDLVSRARSE